MYDWVFTYLRDNITKPIALFTGIFLLVFLLFISIDGLLGQIIQLAWIKFGIYGTCILIWCLYWLWYRNYFPKNKNGYVGILIAVRTENDKQKIRLKNDFTRRMRSLIRDCGLSNKIRIILLNKHQTKRIIGWIEEGISNEVNDWSNIRYRTNAHFVIWGDIKERLDAENKYFFEKNAIVFHPAFSENQQKVIKKEFIEIWFKKISFLEKLEFKGFELSAELDYIAVKYIIGMASLFSRDPELAYKLHQDLNAELTNFNPLPNNLKAIQSKLTALLAEECFLIAWNFITDNNVQAAKKYISKSLDYSLFILQLWGIDIKRINDFHI